MCHSWYNWGFTSSLCPPPSSLCRVYDKNMHLCPFDTGLVERNVELYFSGVVKPIYEENPDPSGGLGRSGGGCFCMIAFENNAFLVLHLGLHVSGRLLYLSFSLFQREARVLSIYLVCSVLQTVFLRSSLVRSTRGGLLGLTVERRHSLASPQVCDTSHTTLLPQTLHTFAQAINFLSLGKC